MRHLDRTLEKRPGQQIHLVMDNDATHKTPDCFYPRILLQTRFERRDRGAPPHWDCVRSPLTARRHAIRRDRRTATPGFCGRSCSTSLAGPRSGCPSSRCSLRVDQLEHLPNSPVEESEPSRDLFPGRRGQFTVAEPAPICPITFCTSAAGTSAMPCPCVLLNRTTPIPSSLPSSVNIGQPRTTLVPR